MQSSKNKNKVTIEALLRIKRNERPKVDFWDSFEQDFQRRRLHALVERPVWQDWLFRPSIKALGVVLPVFTLVALAFFWNEDHSVQPSPLVVSRDQPQLAVTGKGKVQLSAKVLSTDVPLDTSLASSQFVVDAIEDRPGSASKFRKVLYTPAIRLSSPTGASYVRDTMSSSNYQVTTADLKLGRNF